MIRFRNINTYTNKLQYTFYKYNFVSHLMSFCLFSSLFICRCAKKKLNYVIQRQRRPIVIWQRRRQRRIRRIQPQIIVQHKRRADMIYTQWWVKWCIDLCSYSAFSGKHTDDISGILNRSLLVLWIWAKIGAFLCIFRKPMLHRFIRDDRQQMLTFFLGQFLFLLSFVNSIKVSHHVHMNDKPKTMKSNLLLISVFGARLTACCVSLTR